jgi:hypothetical protein
MTGWQWADCEALTLPRFAAISKAWRKFGPLAPYLKASPEEEEEQSVPPEVELEMDAVLNKPEIRRA